MNTQSYRSSSRRNARPKRRRSNPSRSANISTQAQSYFGPLSMPQEQLSIVDLCYDLAAVSTAGGIINDVIGDYPVASPDWTGVAGLFAEYRVLAMTVRFIPNVTGATMGTLLYTPFYCVLDLTSSITALTTYVAAANYALTKVNSLNVPWTMAHRMRGVEEAMFVPTSSAVVDYNFKVFAATLTASTSYGRYFVHWKCQFRGRI